MPWQDKSVLLKPKPCSARKIPSRAAQRDRTLKRTGRKSELQAAQLLHLAPSARQHVPGSSSVLSEPSELLAQPGPGAGRQKSGPADDRPSPSSLAHASRLRAASAAASLSCGRRKPPGSNPVTSKFHCYRGSMPLDRVTLKLPFLNHAVPDAIDSPSAQHQNNQPTCTRKLSLSVFSLSDGVFSNRCARCALMMASP
ncbi:hypothetical protein RCH09_003825 [Actimicrobium sp. GrIS 1.19]|nr:hypothetical protein [Actimicrobium sp. GrIS 1.19]